MQFVNLAPDVCMLSFDERIRQNAAVLGFRIIPEEKDVLV